MNKVFQLTLLCLIFSGCNDSHSNNNTVSIDEIQLIETISNYQDYIFQIAERRVHYGNRKYKIRTVPFIDTISGKYSVDVMLLWKKDTVYLKTINADSLVNKITNYISLYGNRITNDSISLEELKKSRLVDLVPTNGIRDYKSYLIAQLKNEFSNDIYIGFNIRALNGEAGKLWVSNYSYENISFNRFKEESKSENSLSIRRN